MDMHDEPVSSTTHELAREFLEVFEPGKPLDKEGFAAGAWLWATGMS
jgi:hypothetical protein